MKVIDNNKLEVGIKVGVLQNGNMIDSGRIIEIEDGFVSMIDGDEGFGYEMDSIEFVKLATKEAGLDVCITETIVP